MPLGVKPASPAGFPAWIRVSPAQNTHTPPVATRLLCVRSRNPSCSRYGSYTSSIVSASSLVDAAMVSKPTEPLPNLSMMASGTCRSAPSKPSSFTRSCVECLARHLARDDAVRHYLGVVARAAQQAVGYARRPTCASIYLRYAVGVRLYLA